MQALFVLTRAKARVTLTPWSLRRSLGNMLKPKLVPYVLWGLASLTGLQLSLAGEAPSQPSPVVSKTFSQPFFRPDPWTGWGSIPNVTSVAKAVRADGSVAYQATYVIDQFGRRSVLPDGEAATRPLFLLNLGCSVTFGEGVNGDETVTAHLGQMLPQLAPYNYAHPGWGLGNIYAQVDGTRFDRQIPQRRGVVIYLMPTYHIDRLVGGLGTIAWSGLLPHYKLEKDQVVRDGFVQTARPWYTRAIRWYQASFLHQRWQWRWPFETSEEHLNLACRMIKNMETTIAAQFDKTRFLVVLHPHSDGNDLTPCLKQFNITYLDLRTLLYVDNWADFVIAGDGHLNSAGNRLVAEKIASYLREHEGEFLGGAN